MTPHFCHLPHLLCDRILSFQGAVFGGGEDTTRSGLPFCLMWASCHMARDFLTYWAGSCPFGSSWLLRVRSAGSFFPTEILLKGRNAQRLSGVSLDAGKQILCLAGRLLAWSEPGGEQGLSVQGEAWQGVGREARQAQPQGVLDSQTGCL